jgi:hypothetical protein
MANCAWKDEIQKMLKKKHKTKYQFLALVKKFEKTTVNMVMVVSIKSKVK